MDYKDNPYRDNPPRVSPAVLVGGALLAIGAVVLYNRQSGTSTSGDGGSDSGTGGAPGGLGGSGGAPGGLGGSGGKAPPIKNVKMVFIGRPFSKEIVLESLRQTVEERAKSKLSGLSAPEVLEEIMIDVVNDAINKEKMLPGAVKAQIMNFARPQIKKQVQKLGDSGIDLAGNAGNAAAAVAVNAASQLEYPPQLTEAFSKLFSSAVEIPLFTMLMMSKPQIVSGVINNLLPTKSSEGPVLPKNVRTKMRNALYRSLWNKLNEIAPNTAFQGVGALALERAVS